MAHTIPVPLAWRMRLLVSPPTRCFPQTEMVREPNARSCWSVASPRGRNVLARSTTMKKLDKQNCAPYVAVQCELNDGSCEVSTGETSNPSLTLQSILRMKHRTGKWTAPPGTYLGDILDNLRRVLKLHQGCARFCNTKLSILVHNMSMFAVAEVRSQ
jgi:hypothetical protein